MPKRDLNTLTPLEWRYCLEYPKDMNKSEAARRAGAKNPGVWAAQAMKRPRVKKELSRRLGPRVQAASLTVTNVLKLLANVVFLDVADLAGEDGNFRFKSIKEVPKEIRQAVKSIEVQQIVDKKGRVVGQEGKITPMDKNEAFKMAMKYLGLLQPDELNVNVRGQVNISHVLSIDDLDAVLAEYLDDPKDRLEIKKQLLKRLRDRLESQGEKDLGTVDAEARRIEQGDSGKKKRSRK